MSKVLPFSQRFPVKHPREGEATHFVEQILNALEIDFRKVEYCHRLMSLNKQAIEEGKLDEKTICDFFMKLDGRVTAIKNHTIRAGNRWQAEEKFSARVWSARPYNSPQIIFAPERTVQKTYPFVIKDAGYYVANAGPLTVPQLEVVAKNDGLSTDDLECWFNVPAFDGQIICWNDLIEY